MNGYRFTLVLLALGAPAGATAAQGSPAGPARQASVALAAPQDSAQRLAVGDTVRLFGATSKPLRGVLLAVDSASLTVEPLGGDRMITMPRTLITRIQTLRGHPRRGIRAVPAGMLVGVTAGGFAGALAVRPEGGNTELQGVAIVGGAAIGAIVGTAVGVYVALTRSDRWITVGPNTLTLLETP